MIRIILAATLTALMIHLGIAWEQDLEFGKCYWSTPIFYVNDDKTYRIQWTGNQVSSTCKITLHGYDTSNVLNKYKVCIRATEWDIYYDGVTLNYYSDEDVLQDNLRMAYTRSSSSKPTTEWCSESEDYVDVELLTSGFRSTYTGRITLQVTAEMTFNYYKVIAWAVGGSIGGVLLISITCVIVIVVFCRRRKGRSGQVLRNQNMTTITHAGSHQMTGFVTTAYPTAPPAYYPSPPQNPSSASVPQYPNSQPFTGFTPPQQPQGQPTV